MRYSLLAVLAAAGITSAQVSAIPACALQCLVTAVQKTSCSVFDYGCQCSAANSAAIRKLSLPCLCTSKCTPEQLVSVQDATNVICSSALAKSSMTYTTSPIDTAACAPYTGGSAGSSTTTGGSSKTSSGTTSTTSSAESSMTSSSSSSAASSTSSAAMSTSSAMSSSAAAVSSTPASSSAPSGNPAPMVTMRPELLAGMGGIAAAAGYFAL